MRKRRPGEVRRALTQRLVYPDLVGIRPDGIRTMNYLGLISPMVEAIKEQQQEILFLRYMTALALVFGIGGLSAALIFRRRR